VELAKEGGTKAVPMFNLAKVQEKLKELKEAAISYKKALEFLSLSKMHNRKAVRADWENHLAVCQYKLGNRQALIDAEEAIEKLAQADDASDYEKAVWMSGGHMRIAEVVANEDREGARKHMQEAKKIIESDERLKLRAKQWEKLNKKLGL